ncbi:hypothetical protein [Bradyrhizobium liaoningense]
MAIGVLAMLAAVSFLPVLLTPIPAMVDYPNHLARMYILSQNGTSNANPHYEVVWAFYPNLGMDLLVPQMARLMSVENATRLFLLLSQLLVVGGALLLEWTRKGRIHLAGFAALAFLYCLPFSWGFVNFEFGLGLALWGIAVYLMLAERPWPLRFAANLVFVAALFVAHFFSLGIYGATLGLYELWRLRHQRIAYPVAAARLVALALPALALFVVMHLTAGSIGGEGSSWFLGFKPIWPLRIMNGYNLTAAAATGLTLAILLYFATRRGILKLEPAGIWLAIGLALLYLVIPSRLFGTSFADLRIIPAAALILPAFCSLSLPGRAWNMTALAAISCITLINLAVVLAVWLPYRADYAANHRVVPQARSRLARPGWQHRRQWRSALRRPHLVSDVLCADAGRALCRRVRDQSLHGSRQATRTDTRGRAPSCAVRRRNSAVRAACCDCGRPAAGERPAPRPHVVPGLRLSLFGWAAWRESAAGSAPAVGQFGSICSLQDPSPVLKRDEIGMDRSRALGTTWTIRHHPAAPPFRLRVV